MSSWNNGNINKWNNLPTEIVHLILMQLLERYNPKQLLPFLIVNKQWFKVTQPILYRNIDINWIYEDSKLLNTIIHSKYQPGIYVKFLKSRGYSPLRMTYNNMLVLMQKCPYVEKFDCPALYREEGETDIKLFLTMLSNAAIESRWRLCLIPEPGGFDFFGVTKQDSWKIKTYNLLANMMRNTLTHLTIFVDQLKVCYKYLGDHYPKLTSIKILYQKKPSNITHCTQILRYIPRLKKVEIDFGKPSLGVEEINDQNYNLEEHGPFPNIKQLYISHIISPTTEKDLSFIMNTFTGVTSLSLCSRLMHNWSFGKCKRTTNNMTTLEKEFITQYIHKMSHYQLGLITERGLGLEILNDSFQ